MENCDLQEINSIEIPLYSASQYENILYPSLER